MTTTKRLLAGLGAGALLITPLAACSENALPSATDAVESATDQAGDQAGELADDAEAAASDAGAAASEIDPSASSVDCSGTACTVTLSGDGTELDVLGTTVSLGQVQDGRATIGIAGNELSCSEGETVSAGPLSVECTTVTPEQVVLDASLG